MSQKSNRELCEEFRFLLTGRAQDLLAQKKVDDSYESLDLMVLTKEWRNELWKAFREIEDRMCPTPEVHRRIVGGY